MAKVGDISPNWSKFGSFVSNPDTSILLFYKLFKLILIFTLEINCPSPLNLKNFNVHFIYCARGIHIPSSKTVFQWEMGDKWVPRFDCHTDKHNVRLKEGSLVKRKHVKKYSTPIFKQLYFYMTKMSP